MKTVFQRLGFKFTTLGAPLSDEDIFANRKLYWCCLLVSGVLFTGGWLALAYLGTLYGPAGALTPWDTAAAFGMFGGLLVGMITDAELSAPMDSREISEDANRYLKAVAEYYDEVRAHVDAICEQGRPIRRCDEYAITVWISAQNNPDRPGGAA